MFTNLNVANTTRQYWAEIEPKDDGDGRVRRVVEGEGRDADDGLRFYPPMFPATANID